MEVYRPDGTCARQILFEVDKNGILTDLRILGGCPGGMQALIRFSVGRPVAEIIDKCYGIKCKNNTSCPEQLALALRYYIERKQRERQGEINEHHPRGHPKTLPIH